MTKILKLTSLCSCQQSFLWLYFLQHTYISPTCCPAYPQQSSICCHLKLRIRLASTAFSLRVSRPYSGTVHTNVDKSLCLTLTCKDLSFHKESRDLTAPLAAPSLAWISLLQSPFSVIIAPRYLNVSTCSSFLPWHIIAICSFCGVMVITFVFFVLISSPYCLETASTLSNNVCRACGDCAMSSISSAYRRLFTVRPLNVTPIHVRSSAASLIIYSE